MPRYNVMVMTLSNAALTRQPDVFFGYTVLSANDYDARGTFDCEARSPEEAADIAFGHYQNVDKGHLTPDGGRSMMVGDVVSVGNAAGDMASATLLLCSSRGWRLVRGDQFYRNDREPIDLRTRTEQQEAREALRIELARRAVRQTQKTPRYHSIFDGALLVQLTKDLPEAGMTAGEYALAEGPAKPYTPPAMQVSIWSPAKSGLILVPEDAVEFLD